MLVTTCCICVCACIALGLLETTTTGRHTAPRRRLLPDRCSTAAAAATAARTAGCAVLAPIQCPWSIPLAISPRRAVGSWWTVLWLSVLFGGLVGRIGSESGMFVMYLRVPSLESHPRSQGCLRAHVPASRNTHVNRLFLVSASPALPPRPRPPRPWPPPASLLRPPWQAVVRAAGSSVPHTLRAAMSLVIVTGIPGLAVSRAL